MKRLIKKSKVKYLRYVESKYLTSGGLVFVNTHMLFSTVLLLGVIITCYFYA